MLTYSFDRMERSGSGMLFWIMKLGVDDLN